MANGPAQKGWPAALLASYRELMPKRPGRACKGNLRRCGQILRRLRKGGCFISRQSDANQDGRARSRSGSWSAAGVFISSPRQAKPPTGSGTSAKYRRLWCGLENCKARQWPACSILKAIAGCGIRSPPSLVANMDGVMDCRSKSRRHRSPVAFQASRHPPTAPARCSRCRAEESRSSQYDKGEATWQPGGLVS